MKGQHTTCIDCECNKGGRCHDLAVYGVRGGDLLTDSGIRHCYQVNTSTLLTDLVYKASIGKQERVTSPLWQRIRQDLKLLQQEYIASNKDTSSVVEWLTVELRDWQEIGHDDSDDD